MSLCVCISWPIAGGGSSPSGGSGYTMRFVHSALDVEEDDSYTQASASR